MSAQHTPGPWKVFRVKNGENKGKIIGIGDADAGGVTDPFGGLWRSGKELEANAELIAAAPELLEAVQNLMGLFDNAVYRRKLANDNLYSEAVIHARAVIAKATGAA